MSTIFQPSSMNILAPRTALTWDHSRVANVVIDGYVAAFNTIVGGETFSLKRGDVANPWIDIVLVAGDNTAQKVVDRINLASAGLASLVNGHVRITDNDYLDVKTTLTDAVFAKVGLPMMERVRAAAPSITFVVPIVETERANEGVSVTSFAIPNSVNRLGIWLSIIGASSTLGLKWKVLWSNGVEGEGPNFNQYLGGFREVEDPAGVFPSTNLLRMQKLTFSEEFISVGSSVSASTVYDIRVIEVPVPIGATKAFIYPVCSISNENPSLPVAVYKSPLSVRAAIVGGSR